MYCPLSAVGYGLWVGIARQGVSWQVKIGGEILQRVESVNQRTRGDAWGWGCFSSWTANY